MTKVKQLKFYNKISKLRYKLSHDHSQILLRKMYLENRLVYRKTLKVIKNQQTYKKSRIYTSRSYLFYNKCRNIISYRY